MWRGVGLASFLLILSHEVGCGLEEPEDEVAPREELASSSDGALESSVNTASEPKDTQDKGSPRCSLPPDPPLPVQPRWTLVDLDAVSAHALDAPALTAQFESASEVPWTIAMEVRVYVGADVFEPTVPSLVVEAGQSASVSIDVSPWADALESPAAPGRVKVKGSMSHGDTVRTFSLVALNLHRPGAGESMLAYSDRTKVEWFNAGDLQAQMGASPEDPDAPDDPPHLDDFGIGREIVPGEEG